MPTHHAWLGKWMLLVMVSRVRLRGSNLQVLRPIVQLVSVYVVNEFCRQQFASKRFLHHHPMFTLRLAADLESSIPCFRRQVWFAAKTNRAGLPACDTPGKLVWFFVPLHHQNRPTFCTRFHDDRIHSRRIRPTT